MKIKIEDFDFKGRGFGRFENKAVFLDGGIIGDKVLASPIKEKKNYTEAKIIKILEPSPFRKNPTCPYYKNCGGCDFQELDYQKEIEWKTNKVKIDILKFSKEKINIPTTLKNDSTINYRNNIQLKVKDNKIGYFKKNSREIVDIKKCEIAKTQINNTIKILRNIKEVRKLTDIVIRQNEKEEVQVVLIGEKEINTNNILNKLLDIKLNSLYFNKKDKNKRYSDNFKKIYGEDYLEEEVLKNKFLISKESFFQVNKKQSEKLYLVAIDYLEINKDDIILDLYCGIGTTTLALAKQSKSVVGVEVIDRAIRDARLNAELNDIKNVRFITAKAEEIIDKLYESGFKPNKILLDPPRSGVDIKLIEQIKRLDVERIVYISCNPTTQARDIELLKSMYKLEKIQPVDMFSKTVHVECVVLMSRK